LVDYILLMSEKVNEAKLMEIRWFKTDLNGNKKDLYYYNSKVDYTNIFDKNDEPGFHSSVRISDELQMNFG